MSVLMTTTTDSTMPSSSAEAGVPKPSDTFTPFPRLPLELRRKIWQHALPPGDRIVSVVVGEKTPGRGGFWKEIPSYFSYLPLRFVAEPAISASTTDISMLSVCHDARTEYLLANPKFLEAKPVGGKIYYNPSTTIIYVQNWHRITLWTSLRDKALLPSWMADVGRLAMHIGMMDLSFDARTGSGSNEHMHNMHVFENIKEWIGVVTVWTGGDEEEIMSMWKQLENKKQQMEQYKAAKNPSYPIPQLALLDLNPTRTRYLPGL